MFYSTKVLVFLFPATSFGTNQSRDLGVKTVDRSRDKKLSETSCNCPYCDDRHVPVAGKLRKRNQGKHYML